jgi:hypothetical protein
MPKQQQPWMISMLQTANAAQPANAILRGLVVGASNAYPKVFVTVTSDPPMISCLLRPTRFTAPMGVVSPWGNGIFCLNGDISAHGHPSIVNWPADAFTRCAVVRAPTAVEVNTLWMANPALESLGPFALGAPNTEEIQCRFVCPLPAKYAAIALQKRRSPREFWHDVIHAIEADGNTVSCAELLIWARMACTLRTMPAPGADTTSNIAGELTAPVADGNLLDFASEWIRLDLPDRAPVANALGVQQQMLAHQQQLANLIANQQLAAVVANQPKIKTVAEAYPSFMGSILKYCNVDREDQLPPLYHRMANSKRQEQVAVVEHALSARGDAVGWAPPVASPEVVQMIFKMQFTSMDLDALTSGLSLFLMVGTNDPQAGGVRDRQTVFTMVNGNAMAPSMDELSRLVDNAPKMAGDLVALLTILRAYSILLDIVLGINHVLAVAYRGFVRSWDQQAQQSINGHFNATEIPALMPLIQRRLQLETQYWLNQVPLMIGGNLPKLPDFDDILRDVALRHWNRFQAIPARYTVRPALPMAVLPQQ